ncbi:hypothetical protein FO519_010848, partial [Halicephalobus sp. NKZ332]
GFSVGVVESDAAVTGAVGGPDGRIPDSAGISPDQRGLERITGLVDVCYDMLEKIDLGGSIISGGFLGIFFVVERDRELSQTPGVSVFLRVRGF